jgi:hypothetical protein
MIHAQRLGQSGHDRSSIWMINFANHHSVTEGWAALESVPFNSINHLFTAGMETYDLHQTNAGES